MKHISVEQTGWRKPTAELCISEQYAKVGEQLSVPKMQALVAVKRVSAKIGLRAADMMLLDLLCALSQPQDWLEGARPLVWPSNQFLAEQLGLSERAVQRHTKKLGDLGLISFKDNSNGHRRGKRDASGKIIEAYGFDLSPMQARAGEFELLYEEITADRQFIKAMRKRITVSRRSIRGMVQIAKESGLREKFSGEWSSWSTKLDELIEHIPNHSASSSKVAEIAHNFITLHQEVVDSYESALNIQGAAEEKIEATEHARSQTTNYSSLEENSAQKEIPSNLNKTNKLSKNMTSKTDQNDSHILTTNYKNNVISNINQNKQSQTDPIQLTQQNIETHNRKVALEKRKNKHFHIEQGIDHTDSIEKDAINLKISPNMISQSCPEFTKYAKAMGVIDSATNLESWNSLCYAADRICPSIGVSQRDWNDAKAMIGQNSAGIAIALIFEKYQAQEISSPGGYLRALTSRAQIGELHLAKSIYGRISNR